MFQFYSYASPTLQLWFYTIVLLLNIVIFRKQFKNPFYLMVIILFNPAIFALLGKGFSDLHKVFSLVLTLWVAYKYNAFSRFVKGDGLITMTFILFSIIFLTAAWLNNDSWTIMLSQYSRYVITYCLWFIVRQFILKNHDNLKELNKFTYNLILIQILVSMAKFIIFQGRSIESLVGTMSLTGGAMGTTIPILGFIVLWFYRKGNLGWKDWLFVVGLMLIGYTTGKRAVWFILPVVVAAFMMYVPKIKFNKTLIAALLLSPAVFYFGARLTPILNPENKVWGSFDIDYVFDYADTYQFGKYEDQEYMYDNRALDSTQKTKGRGGATISLIDKLFSGEGNLTESDWWGVGSTSMYTTNYEEFADLDLSVKLDHKGSATGLFQTYVGNGYLGIFATLLFFFLMLSFVKMKRLRWVLIAVVAWEYFMYTGVIFRTPAFMFLIIYFIHYSNLLFLQNKKKRLFVTR